MLYQGGRSLIGVIVDGPGDFAALKARFKKGMKVLKTDGPRGHTVSAQSIVGAARKQIGMLQAWGCTSAVLVTDLEQRTVARETFVRQLTNAIESVVLPLPIYVAVPNTMIENWYMADVEEISRRRKFIRSGLRQKPYEGKHGKREIRRVFEKGFDYNEVEHGPQLFPLVRKARAKSNSASFDKFLTALNDAGFAESLGK